MADSIPKFGDWEQPMTQCFENVRRKKNQAKATPPNVAPGDGQMQVPPMISPEQSHRSRGNPAYDSDRQGSGKRNLAYVDGHRSPLHGQPEPMQLVVRGEATVDPPPRTPGRDHRFKPTSRPQNTTQGGIPKFGQWEGNENMTVIFDDLRNKKQVGAGQAGTLPPASPPAPSRQVAAPHDKTGKGSKSLVAQWFKKFREAIFGK